MKKMLSLLAVALLVMGWSGTSFAGNPYASANIGIAWMDDIEGTHVDADERRFSIEMATESGIALTGAIGYDMGAVRAEAEIGYQANDASKLTLYKDGDFDKDWDFQGDISLTTFMVNGYYDIELMEDSGIELFLTAGVGAAFYNFDDLGENKDIDLEDNDRIGTLNGGTYAFQLGAGLGIPVGDGITVDARYRYFNTGDVSTNEDFNGFYMRGDDDAYNLDFSSHSALIGLRYNF